MAGKVLLITGASSGIGAETARHAVAAGYSVVLAARSLAKLEALAHERGSERALAVTCDVREWADLERAVASALERFGRLDAVFANAGFGGARGFEASDPETWREMVLTNVYGAALTIRASLPALRESRGHLLLTGSVAGRVAIEGSLYSATKWAVTGMAESLRKQVLGTGIRVTLVEPGVVSTPFFDEPPKEALEASDIARAVVYALAQPEHVSINEILIRPTSQAG